MEYEVEAFAMATLIFTCGRCPICGRSVMYQNGTIDIELVRKHIEEMNEYAEWKRMYEMFK